MNRTKTEMAYLEIRTSSGDVTQKSLSKTQPISLGSHASNDVCIPEDGVPTMHCRIGWNGKVYEVTAAEPDGVDVNGTLVARASLAKGDVLLIGRTDVVFQAEEALDPELKPLSGEDVPVRRSPPATPKPAGRAGPPEKETAGKGKPGAPSPGNAPQAGKRAAKDKGPAEAAPLPADEPWDPSAADDSPSQMIHRSTVYATAMDDVLEEETRKRQTPLSRILARFQSAPQRPGEQDVVRSPMVLSLGLGSLGLVFVGFAFWFLIGRDSASRQFNAAMDALDQKSYNQAIQQFDRFLLNYPANKLAEKALDERGKAKIESQIMGSTPRWESGHQALDEFIVNRRDSVGFRDLHELLAGYAELIARGAARSAEETKERGLLDVSRKGKELLLRYSPKESPPTKAVQEIDDALVVAEAAILKHETLNAALAEMESAIQSKQPMASFAARRNLLDRYADLVTNRTLVDKLNATLDVEKGLVAKETAEREALRPSDGPPPAQPLTLALHTRSRTDEASNGRCVFVLAGGCCFGIDAVTGEPVWRHAVGLETPFFPIEVMTSVEGLLVFDTSALELQLLERANGKLTWRQPLAERVTGAPLVHEGQIYAATEGGHLYRIDLETGTVSGFLRFSQPVHGPPVLLGGGTYLALAGREDVVYTLTARPLDCAAVSYVGQRPGSIQSPLLAMGKLLLMADNDRRDSCLLRVLRPEDGKPRLVEVATARIAGIVRDAPVLRGNELVVPSSAQRLAAFSVTDDPNQPPLTSVAAYQVQSEHEGPLYLAAGPDGQLWMASGALRKFQVTTDSIDLMPKQAAVGLSTQPLQSIGRHLFLGRRLVYSNAVLFTQTDRESMTSQWRTILGGSLLSCVDSGDGSALCISESGDLFRPSEQELRAGGFLKVAAGQLRLPEVVTDPLRAARLPDGRLAVSCGRPEPTLWIVSATGLIERTIPLEDPLEADPTEISAGLVLPLPGRLKVVGRSQSQSEASEYVTGLGKDQKPRWLAVSAVDAQEILALDSSGRLARIEFRTSPRPHLAEVAGVQIANPVDVPFVVRERQAFLADAAGNLQMLDARSLEVRASTKLPAAATSSPWLLGERLYVETGGNELQCFDVGETLKRAWSCSLQGDGLAGPPVVSRDGLLLAARNGDILTLDPETGQIKAQHNVGQRLSLGPTPVGRTFVVAAIDGSLYPINELISPAE